MKKLIVLFLLVLVGCSKEKVPKEQEETAKIDFKFEGKKLMIANDSEKVLTVFESETTFLIEKNKEWVLTDRTTGLLARSGGALSKSVYEYDLTNELSEIDSNKVKVTVYYTLGSSGAGKTYAKELLYEE
ncbi:hypothetical protein [Enterococcus caccae]|uniref:Lipoprotein n=1 Tax=Enterococcus caccae ATCC BAA-1240 TaxID=1158612 RepID=R3WG51_9ENTE|nr:hypothetical protein [Enterococcus caccae]EOL46422.1 hypothetical protein UC7_01389 [Enterococcus caccae ATCC BAA-1240]EOT60791.1 hypothetical protein I580_01691 [Enterococcus caccae ATCC BAA-1240]